MCAGKQMQQISRLWNEPDSPMLTQDLAAESGVERAAGEGRKRY